MQARRRHWAQLILGLQGGASAICAKDDKGSQSRLMYSFSWKRVGPLPEGRWPRLSSNVMFLGLTSMLTDISAEMVASILPVYLVIAVGLSPLQFGFVDGVSRGVAVIAHYWAALPQTAGSGIEALQPGDTVYRHSAGC